MPVIDLDFGKSGIANISPKSSSDKAATMDLNLLVEPQ
jgi:hypothetical protein